MVERGFLWWKLMATERARVSKATGGHATQLRCSFATPSDRRQRERRGLSCLEKRSCERVRVQFAPRVAQVSFSHCVVGTICALVRAAPRPVMGGPSARPREVSQTTWQSCTPDRSLRSAFATDCCRPTAFESVRNSPSGPLAG
jgi:hypothetical protein